MIILGTNSIKDTGYEVANSCRFDGSSAYLVKNFSSSANRKTMTISMWVKGFPMPGSGVKTLMMAGSQAEDRTQFTIDDVGRFAFTHCSGIASNTKLLETTRLFRDPAAWYNFVVQLDSTQGTAANRTKIFCNGEQITSFGTEQYVDQNEDFYFSFTSYHTHIGRFSYSSSNFFSGYMAEIVQLTGSAVTPSTFGEADEDSPTIWKPKDLSDLDLSSTNSFYLDFEDSSALGNDVSGNNNDFTSYNLAATDQTTDTCTNNFATLNSLVNFNSGVFSEGNLAITFGDDTVSTIGLTRGRWYWEAQRTNSTNEAHFGIGVSNGFYSATSIVSSGDRLYVRGGTSNFNTASNLSILTFGSNSGTPASFGSGDILSFYLDLESSTKNIIIKKNDGATPLANVDLTYSGEEPIFPFCRMNSGCASSWNFGNPINSLSSANTDANGFGSFEFSPTLSGVDYFAICTKNLAEYG